MLLYFFLPLILLVEALYAAGSVDDLLLAREEGVALIAELYLERLPGGSRGEIVAARAGNIGICEIFRMDFLFHYYCPG